MDYNTQNKQPAGQQLDRQNLATWLNNASPEDAAAIAKQALQRLSGAPQDQKNRFIEDVNRDPKVAELLRVPQDAR